MDKYTCNKCGKEKEHIHFYARDGGDGKRRVCKRCIADVARDRYRANRERYRENAYSRNRTIRKEVIEHYGGRCECCGESNEMFLTIDHPNNDGAEHRKTLTTNIQRWLKRNGFPDGFRLMCYNCNIGRQMNYLNRGTCPHKM